MTIHFHKRFVKRSKKLSLKDYDLLQDKLVLFLHNPFNEILRNHPLTGDYFGYRRIDIRGDLLALYRELGNATVQFRYLGTHHELYGT